MVALGLQAPGWAAGFAEARIFIEYNSTDNDLGFHVFLDGEDWRELRIINPKGRTIFEVEGGGAFRDLGLEGRYRFIGVTADGDRLSSRATLTHAVPDGPSVSAEVFGDIVIIRWDPVTGPPEDFPDKEIEIVGYQVIVGSFQVTLPGSSKEVTVPREFVESLEPGEHGFEVLAIEAGGNQTITAGSFETE